MKLIIDNVSTQAVIGGSDNLLDFDLMDTLNKYMRVRVDGYAHSTLYKRNLWDGYQNFINNKGFFATGFLPMVSAYLEELGVEIHVQDNRLNLPEMNDIIDDFVGNIEGKDWYGRDYQVELIPKLNNYITIAGNQYYFPRGIFDAATNAGKNSVAALVINNLKNKEDTTIFMVSNITIYQQAVAFFSDVMGEPCGQVNDKKCDFKRITVCMVKSLYNKALKSVNVQLKLAATKVLIVDESDEAGATQYSRCLTLIGAGMRLFISGTPLDSSAVNNMVAIGLSGQILGVVTNDYLIENGWSQRPLVRILLNDTPTFMESYPDELRKTVHESMNRVKVISEEIIKPYSDKQILITFITKEHGYFMLEQLQKLHPEISMDIVHGTSSERTKIISNFNKKEITVMFTSVILKRGANIPNIQVGVNSQAGKSRTTVKQFTGRYLRHDGTEESVLVFDFYDTGKYVGDHSRKRIKVYEGEGFTITKNYEEKRGKPVL